MVSPNRCGWIVDDHHITDGHDSQATQGMDRCPADFYPESLLCCARHAPGATPTRALKLRLKAGMFS
jgi:hypothetical protein